MPLPCPQRLQGLGNQLQVTRAIEVQIGPHPAGCGQRFDVQLLVALPALQRGKRLPVFQLLLPVEQQRRDVVQQYRPGSGIELVHRLLQ